MSRRRYLIIVGIVVAAVSVSILWYTMLANHPPVITSLTAKPERVVSLGNCQVVCNATAPGGNELSYNWSASGGIITGEGATVTWTAPRSAGSYNVAVKVTDGRGGEATDYVVFSVRTNSPPIIASLVPDAAWTTPSGNVQVTCTASDPDGDELSYEWTATGGDISNAGGAINWTAPQEVGTYNVTLVVSDGCGGEDTKSVTLSVVLGTPPTIENLIVTAQRPKYLKASSAAECDYDVWGTQEYHIECVASNTSGELVYDWSCTDGEISGEGSNITWTAPNEISVRVKVTVIVSDAAGNSVGRDTVFCIPYCSCAFG